jgi:hypothetical protein
VLGASPAVLLGATMLLLVAHVARALRWSLLFPARYVDSRFNLLLALALGYLVNALLPLRLGELVRAAFISGRESVRFPFSAATVAAERLVDVFAVALIALAVATSGGQDAGRLTLLSGAMLASAATGIVGLVLVRRSAGTRRFVWWCSSVFNTRLQLALVDFCWSVSEIVASRVFLTARFLLATGVMWSLYGLSYVAFGRATGESFGSVVYLLLGQPLSPLLERVANSGDVQGGLGYLAYTAMPVCGIVAFGLTRQWGAIVRLLRMVGRYGRPLTAPKVGVTRDRYRAVAEYEYFLASMFSGDNRVVSGFGLKADDDAIVHRLLQGGSDALTALVETRGGGLVIRKFAVDVPAEKLRVQADWIRAQGNRGLPLVNIAADREGPGFYRYDMPFVVSSDDLYDVIHTAPLEHGRALLLDVIDHVHDFHRASCRGIADEDVVRAYLRTKAVANAARILQFVRSTLPSERYSINGESFHVDEWFRLLDLTWLAAQVRDRRITTIHGDLTIENVIVAPTSEAGWYAIDPNPGNILDSPLIDWAKLMQSVHLGYEGLNRSAPSSLQGGEIRLLLTRSRAYAELHSTLETQIIRRLGSDALREVYFHELVHFLRLTPYKIRRDARQGLTFFACTSLLLRRYVDVAE